VAVNWTAYLQQDPLLPGILEALHTQGITDLTGFTGGAGSDIIRSGLTPDLSGTPFASYADRIITPQIRDLAAQATRSGISQWGQILHQGDITRAEDLAHMRARGALNSGALGVHLREDQYQQNLAQANATQQLLDSLSGRYQNYLDQGAAERQQAASATNDAFTRIMAQINANMIGGGGTSKTAAPGAGGGTGGAPVGAGYRSPYVGYGAGGQGLTKYGPWAYPRAKVAAPSTGYEGNNLQTNLPVSRYGSWSYPKAQPVVNRLPNPQFRSLFTR